LPVGAYVREAGRMPPASRRSLALSIVGGMHSSPRWQLPCGWVGCEGEIRDEGEWMDVGDKNNDKTQPQKCGW
jgi:hypothetical protein